MGLLALAKMSCLDLHSSLQLVGLQLGIIQAALFFSEYVVVVISAEVPFVPLCFGGSDHMLDAVCRLDLEADGISVG